MAAKRSSTRGRRPQKRIPLWVLGLLALVLCLVVAARVGVGLYTPRAVSVKSPPLTKRAHYTPPVLYNEDHNLPSDQGFVKAGRASSKLDVVSSGTEVSIVIDDVGYRLDLAKKAAAVLPRSVTFAVIPHLRDSESSARLLHDNGFPIILHAPMEPEDQARWNPGPDFIAPGMSYEEVARILDGDFAGVPFAEGMNNHMGSRATQDKHLMNEVMLYLKSRRLYFLDSRTTPRTVAYDVARSNGVPAAFRRVFLDDVEESGAIMKQLKLLVASAGKEGPLVGIGHLRPKTIDALAAGIPYWESRGVRFVPLRKVVH